MNKEQIKKWMEKGSTFCARIAVIYNSGVTGHVWVELNLKDLMETLNSNDVKEIVAPDFGSVVFCEPEHEQEM